MSIQDIRAHLRSAGVDGAENCLMSYGENGKQIYHIGDRAVEVGPMATSEDIRAAFLNPFILETKHVSVTGYEPGSIQARLAALKEQGRQRRDAALAKLDDAGKKHEHVSEEIERVAAQIEKEADDALAEFAQFSNGAPA